MVTVRTVFNEAIHLIDWQKELNGLTDNEDTTDYKRRIISILNTKIPELAIYSEDTDTQGLKEHYLRQNEDELDNPDLEQSIPLDDDLTMALLPFWAASQLSATEHPELAEWFKRMYDEAFFGIRDRLKKGKWEKIPLPYGTF